MKGIAYNLIGTLYFMGCSLGVMEWSHGLDLSHGVESWIGVLDLSHGVESWIGVLDLSQGVEPFKELNFERNRKPNYGGEKFVSGPTYAITKCVTNA